MARNSAPPNKEIFEAALLGLEAQRAKLDEQIAHVRSLLGRRVGRPSRSEAAAVTESTKHLAAPARKKRVLSAEARKRIAAAQKKRWAAFRKTQ